MEMSQFTTYNVEASISADLDAHEKLMNVYFYLVLFKQCSCNTFRGTALKIMNNNKNNLYRALLLLHLHEAV